MKNYKLAIYAPIKDELTLKEWILYYTKLNIDLFIIRDNNSAIPVITYFNELNIKNVEILWDDYEVSNGDWERVNIINEHILPICKKYNIDYLINIDADEFLYLNHFENIQQMMNFYQPFDELNINWLIFSDNNQKEANPDSLIKYSNMSGKYLCFYTKSITKVSSIITGLNAHNMRIYDNSIIKNIFNKIISSLGKRCGTDMKNRNYNDAPIFMAHYVYKGISQYVEKKLCTNGGNLNSIFSNKWVNLKPCDISSQQKKLFDYHKEHKNDLIEYIYSLKTTNNELINELENKHPFFEENKKYYKRYYTWNGHDLYNKMPNGENYYTINNKLLEYFYM
jgi:hypothetical protein